MAEIFQLFLKVPQRNEIIFFRSAGFEIRIFKECVNFRLTCFLKLGIRGIKFFFSELARLCKEQADEDVAGTYLFVVLVLQASFRHRVKKVLPAINREINTVRKELIVLLSEV